MFAWRESRWEGELIPAEWWSRADHALYVTWWFLDRMATKLLTFSQDARRAQIDCLRDNEWSHSRNKIRANCDKSPGLNTAFYRHNEQMTQAGNTFSPAQQESKVLFYGIFRTSLRHKAA